MWLHWSAFCWILFSPSHFICRKTELDYTTQYQRRISACFFYERRLETFRALFTTSKNSPSPPLLAAGRTPERTWYVRYDALQFLLAAHGKRSLQNCQRLSFMCPKPPNQNETKKEMPASALQAIGVCWHGYASSVYRQQNSETKSLSW